MPTLSSFAWQRSLVRREWQELERPQLQDQPHDPNDSEFESEAGSTDEGPEHESRTRAWFDQRHGRASNRPPDSSPPSERLPLCRECINRLPEEEREFAYHSPNRFVYPSITCPACQCHELVQAYWQAREAPEEFPDGVDLSNLRYDAECSDEDYCDEVDSSPGNSPIFQFRLPGLDVESDDGDPAWHPNGTPISHDFAIEEAHQPPRLGPQDPGPTFEDFALLNDDHGEGRDDEETSDILLD